MRKVYLVDYYSTIKRPLLVLSSDSIPGTYVQDIASSPVRVVICHILLDLLRLE
jgi:hypothetical protein